MYINEVNVRQRRKTYGGKTKEEWKKERTLIRMNEWTNERMNECMNKWMNEWMNEWMHVCMNDEWMNEWRNELTNDEWKYGSNDEDKLITDIVYMIRNRPLTLFHQIASSLWQHCIQIVFLAVQLLFQLYQLPHYNNLQASIQLKALNTDTKSVLIHDYYNPTPFWFNFHNCYCSQCITHNRWLLYSSPVVLR